MYNKARKLVLSGVEIIYTERSRSMAKINKDEVEKIAQLARLDLKEGDTKKYQTELSAILDYVEIINKVDVKNVEPTAQVTGLSDVFAEDKSRPSYLGRDEILKNAPDKKDGFIKVKKVLE